MKTIIIASQFSTILILAAFCGVMICIYTAHVPFWKQVPPEEFLGWFSTYSVGISNATGPFGMLSLVLPLITLILTWSNTNSRLYWLLSFLLILGVIAITMVFFVKANTSFMNKTIAIETIPDTLVTWGKLHLVRIIMTTFSAISAAIGVTKYYR